VLQGDSQPQRAADGSVLWHGFITILPGASRPRKTLREEAAPSTLVRVTEAMGEIGIGLFIVDAVLPRPLHERTR